MQAHPPGSFPCLQIPGECRGTQGNVGEGRHTPWSLCLHSPAPWSLHLHSSVFPCTLEPVSAFPCPLCLCSPAPWSLCVCSPAPWSLCLCSPACKSLGKSFKIHQNFNASTQDHCHNVFLHCFSIHQSHYFMKQMRNTFRLLTESLQNSPKSIKIHQLFLPSSLNTFTTSI